VDALDQSPALCRIRRAGQSLTQIAQFPLALLAANPVSIPCCPHNPSWLVTDQLTLPQVRK